VELLLFNLAMDLRHPSLGFAAGWVTVLASRFDHVSVITMWRGEFTTPPNVEVHSLGKEKGWSEPRRLIEFYRLVHSVLQERRIDVCFVHMAPLFAVMLSPIARAKGIPILLWYAHGATPRLLRVAHAVSDRCITSTPAGFRLPSNKLFVIGQGIDTEMFRPTTNTDPKYSNTAITVGRITPTKTLEETVAAISLLRERDHSDLRLEIFGEPLTGADQEYAKGLRRQVRELKLESAVRHNGLVPFDRVPACYQQGEFFMNMSRNRSIDKAILESMAAGCIPISRNESFRALAAEHDLEFLVPAPGAAGVAEALSHAMALPRAERRALSSRLRTLVEEEHSLSRLSRVVASHLEDLVKRPRVL
jgi:glycosyltransferase involved in cell wall biosynthesis